MESSKRSTTWGIQEHAQCIRCGQAETIDHLFLHCLFAKEVWDLAPLKDAISSDLILSLQEGFLKSKHMINLPPTSITDGPIFSWIAWMLWLARNQLIFQNRSFTARETITKATHDAYEWTKAQTKERKLSIIMAMLTWTHQGPDATRMWPGNQIDKSKA